MTKTLNRREARNVINASDMNALEWALRLKDAHGGTVWVLSMGPPNIGVNLSDAIALGADEAFLISDRALAESDTLPTSLALARAISKAGGADLVLCGDESSDSSTGQVPSSVAEHLDYSQITFAKEIEVDEAARVVRGTRELEDSEAVVESDLPCVISVLSGSNRPRYALFSRRKEARATRKPRVWTIADLGLAKEEVGAAGSPTRVGKVTAAPSAARAALRIRGEPREVARKLIVALEARGALEEVR